jgi:hypothetical protein
VKTLAQYKEDSRPKHFLLKKTRRRRQEAMKISIYIGAICKIEEEPNLLKNYARICNKTNQVVLWKRKEERLRKN